MKPGDTIEFSISQEIPSKNSSSWVKFGVVTKIMPGETATKAQGRAMKFVMDGLEDAIAELMQ